MNLQGDTALEPEPRDVTHRSQIPLTMRIHRDYSKKIGNAENETVIRTCYNREVKGSVQLFQAPSSVCSTLKACCLTNSAIAADRGLILHANGVGWL